MGFLGTTVHTFLDSLNAVSLGISIIFFAIICSTTARRLDKKYKKKLYDHPNGKDLIITIIPLPNSVLVKIRMFRLMAYILVLKAEKRKKGRFYRLQQDILPECSYKKDVVLYDKIICLLFMIIGFAWFIIGIVWFLTVYL